MNLFGIISLILTILLAAFTLSMFFKKASLDETDSSRKIQSDLPTPRLTPHDYDRKLTLKYLTPKDVLNSKTIVSHRERGGR